MFTLAALRKTNCVAKRVLTRSRLFDETFKNTAFARRLVADHHNLWQIDEFAADAAREEFVDFLQHERLSKTILVCAVSRHDGQ